MLRRIFTLFIVQCLLAVLAGEKWGGKWFPLNPEEEAPASPASDVHNIQMGVYRDDCDNATYNLKTDFDPDDWRHRLRGICLQNRSSFKPNYDVQPILREYLVPKCYVPLHKCMNETINYEERLPTFGTHRPLWATFGEYIYLPIQRWLHNIEHGSIVMLYHPCANSNQVEKLKLIVQNCLYRHVITPSERLLPERPLALVAWARSLELNVVDRNVIIEFIRSSALHGPEHTARNGQYNKLLIKPAKFVSNQVDEVVCPNDP